MLSVHSRLLVAATVVLGAFVGMAGWALENAYRNSAETALKETLQSHIYGLLAAADVDNQGKMQLPIHLPEPRFSRPDSGLYAFVTAQDNKLFWRSPSSIGFRLPDIRPLKPGQKQFHRRGRFFLFSYGVDWEDDQGTSEPFTFAIAEQANNLDEQLSQFRTTLWSWLGGISLALLLLQGAILRWSLTPLRTVTEDLDAIRNGTHTHLEGSYPKELQGLTSNLNALLAHDKRLQNRYRTTLDNLAHSLKTPLAYLSSVLQGNDQSGEQLRNTIQDQVARMDHIVQHQLRRAAVSARTTLAAPLPVAPILHRLLTTLKKIHAGRNIQVIDAIDDSTQFQGDEEDFMEIFGNLLENAFKYSRQKIAVTAKMNPALELIIEDDGNGISSQLWQQVLKRGTRADESTSGQGIGLTVANEIIQLYGGKLIRDKSELGGLKLYVFFGKGSPDRS
jgi:two-component system sensor histidine kinase PhoQ